MQAYLDGRIKTLHVQNCYFPMFVSEARLNAEKVCARSRGSLVKGYLDLPHSHHSGRKPHKLQLLHRLPCNAQLGLYRGARGDFCIFEHIHANLNATNIATLTAYAAIRARTTWKGSLLKWRGLPSRAMGCSISPSPSVLPRRLSCTQVYPLRAHTPSPYTLTHAT